jgi:hypothetical protein
MTWFGNVPPPIGPLLGHYQKLREYVFNANEPVLILQEQNIMKHSHYFTRSPRPADKSNSQFALSPQSLAM